MTHNAERDATDVTEALEQAWRLLEEANDLGLYAMRLIENTSLRAMAGQVARELRAVKFSYVRLVQSRDAIPECCEIRRRLSPTAVDLDPTRRRITETQAVSRMPRPIGLLE